MKITFREKLKERFNWDVSGIGTYVNQESDKIMVALIFSSGLTSRVTVMENVKGSEKVKLLDVNFDLQNADGCTLTDDGTIIFTDVTITTERIGVQGSLCNEDLNGTWAQLLNAVGANRQDEEPPLEDVISAFVIKLAKKKNQDLMFNGNTLSADENLNFYDGYIKRFMNSSLIKIATRVGATITSSNAFDNAINVYNTIDGKVFDNMISVEIIMSRANARNIIAQVWNDKDFNAKIDFTDVDGELSFILPTTDITVRSYPQLAEFSGANQMFAVIYPWMIYGTDLLEDEDGFFMKFLEEKEVLRFGLKWRSGVEWIFEEDFVRLSTGVS